MVPALDFYRQTRRALSHLDDVVFLENLPLAAQLSTIGGQSRGQALRRALRMVIQSLDPSAEENGSPVDTTAYHVLYQYAIARRSVIAISTELGLSERSTYYALEQSCQAVTRMLEDQIAARSAEAADGVDSRPAAAQVRDEIDRLATFRAQIVDLAEVVQEVIDGTGRLAETCGATIELAADVGNHAITINRVLLRQTILNLSSALCRQPGEVHVLIQEDQKSSGVDLVFLRQPAILPDMDDDSDPLTVAEQLAGALSISWRQANEAGKGTTVALRIPRSQRRTVLIVDDNEGLISLFRRFLRGHPYDVVAAKDHAQALSMLEEQHPDIILLDVMLPHQDGWEVLQDIRRQAPVPVIMCSIINDPRLAASMGADGFLHKPVNRADLIQALDQVSQVPE